MCLGDRYNHYVSETGYCMKPIAAKFGKPAWNDSILAARIALCCFFLFSFLLIGWLLLEAG